MCEPLKTGATANIDLWLLCAVGPNAVAGGLLLSLPLPMAAGLWSALLLLSCCGFTLSEHSL